MHRELRQRDLSSGVLWSLWVGQFAKAVPWLLTDRFKETRYAFLLFLEKDGFVAVLGSNVGDVADSISDDRVSYQKLLALHSRTASEVESLSTRSLRAARVGVTHSTQRGRHLEQTVSRVGANQSAPVQLSIRQADRVWKISPGSGRVVVSGGRVLLPELCSWFDETCQEIELATDPSEFMKSFAHPITLDDLPAAVVPTALQLDSSLIDELIESGATLQRNDVALSDGEIEALRQLIRELWIVVAPRNRADSAANTWRLMVDATEMGQLIIRSTKITFASSHLAKVAVVRDDGTSQALANVFNGGSQPLRLTFSDATYAYSAGQLFRDHRLLNSRVALLAMLSDDLPAHARVEKGDAVTRFTADSLFGFVVATASGGDDFLVCDDMGAEWADFIGVSTATHQVTFYHCKGGSIDVGASGLHEVVSQAAKNLGYLTASRGDLQSRRAKWDSLWRSTAIPRLQRGVTVDGFVSAFSDAVAAPQATRRVALITSSLSKSALRSAFDGLDINAPKAEVLHVLWLLSLFVDQCRNIGAVPQIICRP